MDTWIVGKHGPVLRFPAGYLLVLVLASGLLGASTIQIRTVDLVTNRPLPRVLVIIRPLDDAAELGRFLSNEAGEIPPIQLYARPYRIIATCPGGGCDTVVREVFGTGAPARISIRMPGVSPSWTVIQILDAARNPFPKVLVIVRAAELDLEVGRYLTDSDGKIPAVWMRRNQLYRVTVTCPYWVCETKTFQVYGPAKSSEMQLEAPVVTTDQGGEMVGDPTALIRVELKGRTERSSVTILVRDLDAKWERRYQVSSGAEIRVPLPTLPLAIAVLREKCVVMYQLSTSCSSAESDLQEGEGCLRVDQEIRLDVPACK